MLWGNQTRRTVGILGSDAFGDYYVARFLHFRSLLGVGTIVQQAPVSKIVSPDDFLTAQTSSKKSPVACERKPTNEEYDDLIFGWNLEMGVTSNSVLFVRDGVTVAIGTGEQDRVGCAEIAVAKAYTKYADRICFERYGVPYNVFMLETVKGEREVADREAIDAQTAQVKGGLLGSCMISDGFFPFRDGVDVGIRQGITAVAQPGGSIRDKEVIKACNEADPQVAMVFTGQRAFKH